jgi:hypothetical protein
MDTLAVRDHRRAERLTDLLDSIRAELRTRLDELHPLVREYERLREAETALADGPPKRAGQPKRAGVAQNLRRMLDRGEVREEALPGAATGYRIAEEQTAPSASGRQGETG